MVRRQKFCLVKEEGAVLCVVGGPSAAVWVPRWGEVGKSSLQRLREQTESR